MTAHNIWLFALGVIFVAVNGLTQLSYAYGMGFKMKPTGLGFLLASIMGAFTGSATPLSGQAAMLTISGKLANLRERTAALILAGAGMVILGALGLISEAVAFAGTPVVMGMMAGVGLMLAEVGAVTMWRSNARTSVISIISALAIWGFTRNLVYTVAGSVLLATLDYLFIQKRRVDMELSQQAIAAHNNISTEEYYDAVDGDIDGVGNGDINGNSLAGQRGSRRLLGQTETARFWTRDYWRSDDWHLIRPQFNSVSIIGAFSLLALSIGVTSSFGIINSNISGVPAHLDGLTLMTGLADLPSILFGGAPLASIISGTSGAPWPVLGAVAVMAVLGILCILGLVVKICKYIPYESIAGFLVVIGLFSTFIPNVTGAFASGYTAQAAVALAVTAITKNPFFGLVAGVLTRYIGFFFGL